MEDGPLKIAIVAGEPSGDRQGAALIGALREMVSPRSVEAWGIGGHFLREAGVALRHDSDPWAAIGIADTLLKIPGMLWVLADMKRALRRNPPDVLVVVDAGAFNVPLARWVKRHKVCPVFYYFPPGSWRRLAALKPGKKNLATVADRIVTPFAWSEALLRAGGADAHFVGHPLLDLVKPALTDDEFYERFGLDRLRPIVALLPGSRHGEIRHILPALVGAAEEISHRIPGVQFVVALASSGPRGLAEDLIHRNQATGQVLLRLQQVSRAAREAAQQTLAPPAPVLATNEGFTLPSGEWKESAVRSQYPPHTGPAPLVICEGLTWDALSRADLVITKSGTATLEAMILKKPMIIVYRGSRLMALEFRLRRSSHGIVHLGMPNILADERLFPELLGEQANPKAIADLAVDLLLEPGRILTLKDRLTALVADNLGKPGGVGRATSLLLEMMTSHQPKAHSEEEG